MDTPWTDKAGDDPVAIMATRTMATGERGAHIRHLDDGMEIVGADVRDDVRQPSRIAITRPLRSLPLVSDAARTTVPGVGVFAREDVANAYGVSGFNLYFQPQDQLEAVGATIRFKLILKEDFSPSWSSRFVRELGLSFEHRAAMEQHGRAIAKALEQRSPGDYASHLIEAIAAEVRSLSATQRDLRDMVKRYRGWLLDPTLPKRKPDSEGRSLIPGNEEAAERRKLWRRELGRAESQLTQFETSSGQRLIQLRYMHSQLKAEQSQGIPHAINTTFQGPPRHRAPVPRL